MSIGISSVSRVFKTYQGQVRIAELNEYRRFGKTEEKISVITLGGMRFKDGWNPPRAHLPSDSRVFFQLIFKIIDFISLAITLIF